MLWSTPVTLPLAPPQPLTSESRVLLLGSCFAQEVGERLVHQLPEGHVVVNPLGPMYSPAVVAHALRQWLTRTTPFEQTATSSKQGGNATEKGAPAADAPLPPFLGQDGRWHVWQASSVCSAATEEECRARYEEAWKRGRSALMSATHLIITFGTTRHYRLSDAAGQPLVANCHKEPAARFIEEDPSLDSLISEWTDLLNLFQAAPFKADSAGPSLIFTVSPYRYRKYGMHESQLQKAKLLLLCDALCNPHLTISPASTDLTSTSPAHPHGLPPGGEVPEGRRGAFYFPSYEILLDELRDYRFYAPDLLHPSPQAIDEIAERFRQWAFTPELLQEADARLKAYRRSQHRDLTISFTI